MVNRNYDRTNLIEINREKAAQGYMDESEERTSVSASVSSLSVIENIPSYTFKAGRRYRLVWDFTYVLSVANDYFDCKINSASIADDSALTTGLTELIKRPITAALSGAGQHGRVTAFVKYAVDTTVQLKYTVQRTVGTGTFQMEANKAYFIIEDVGSWS